MLTDATGSSQVLNTEFRPTQTALKKRKVRGQRRAAPGQGAVSAEVAEAMAKGVQRTESRADIGIGITGLTNRDGGTDKKPVGLVFVSLSTEKNFLYKTAPSLKGREEIRLRSAMEALNMVRLYIFKDADFLSTKKGV